jgi:hypothetical protein
MMSQMFNLGGDCLIAFFLAAAISPRSVLSRHIQQSFAVCDNRIDSLMAGNRLSMLSNFIEQFEQCISGWRRFVLSHVLSSRHPRR